MSLVNKYIGKIGLLSMLLAGVVAMTSVGAFAGTKAPTSRASKAKAAATAKAPKTKKEKKERKKKKHHKKTAAPAATTMKKTS